MDGFLSFLRSLGVGRLIAMGGVAATLIAFFIYLTLRMTAPPMGLLFSGLDGSDSGAIVSKLESMDVPYRLGGDGGTIMAPQDQVLRLRMSLAQEGLPAGGGVGYEIFDRGSTLGSTSFEQNINRLRAMEGELARTISALNKVASARVHLVLPERQLFSRDQRPPSASIILRTRGGQLTHSEVLAIQHLVASAVPSLEPNQISIIDQNSTLLARGGESDPANAFTAKSEERRLAYESRLKNQIEKLISSFVGEGRVRAEVSAEMDFDRTTLNAEIYDPEGQVVRSTQTVEQRSNERKQSNQTGASVSVASNLPETAASGGAGNENSSNDSRTEESVVYEISKTIRNEIHEAGNVRRLSVAVLVDGSYQEGADGAKTYQARTEEELNQIRALVRSAIGFNEPRGDTVEVVNLQFNEEASAYAAPAEEGLFDFTRDDLVRLIEIAALLVVSLLVMLLVIRPILRGIIAPKSDEEGMSVPQIGADGAPVAALAAPGQEGAPGGHPALTHSGQTQMTREEAKALALRIEAGGGHIPDDIGIETMIDIANVEGRVKESALKKVGGLVERHPDEAVAVMRNWLYSD